MPRHSLLTLLKNTSANIRHGGILNIAMRYKLTIHVYPTSSKPERRLTDHVFTRRSHIILDLLPFGQIVKPVFDRLFASLDKFPKFITHQALKCVFGYQMRFKSFQHICLGDIVPVHYALYVFGWVFITDRFVCISGNQCTVQNCLDIVVRPRNALHWILGICGDLP